MKCIIRADEMHHSCRINASFVPMKIIRADEMKCIIRADEMHHSCR